MSAVEEYRAALECAASHDVFLTSGAVEILADAAIASLEAARAETFGQFQHMAKVALEQQRRAEKAEAKLG